IADLQPELEHAGLRRRTGDERRRRLDRETGRKRSGDDVVSDEGRRASALALYLERIRLAGDCVRVADLELVIDRIRQRTRLVLEPERAGAGRDDAGDRADENDEQQNAQDPHETPFLVVHLSPDPAWTGRMLARSADVRASICGFPDRF